MELTSVCIESTLDVYRNDFTCVSKRLRFVSKRLVSKRLVSKRLVSKRPYDCCVLKFLARSVDGKHFMRIHQRETSVSIFFVGTIMS